MPCDSVLSEKVWPCEASQADLRVSGAKTQRFSDVKT